MFGVKYRYEILDDKRMKLRPTKDLILVTAATNLAFGAMMWVLAAAAKKNLESAMIDLEYQRLVNEETTQD